MNCYAHGHYIGILTSQELISVQSICLVVADLTNQWLIDPSLPTFLTNWFKLLHIASPLSILFVLFWMCFVTNCSYSWTLLLGSGMVFTGYGILLKKGCGIWDLTAPRRWDWPKLGMGCKITIKRQWNVGFSQKKGAGMRDHDPPPPPPPPPPYLWPCTLIYNCKRW